MTLILNILEQHISSKLPLFHNTRTRPLLADVGLKFERAEMQMIRWMCGVSMKDRKKCMGLFKPEDRLEDQEGRG